MFTVPCFISVLSSPHHSDVLRPFETECEALAQVHAWLPAGATVVPDPTSGYVYAATVGTGTRRVRVRIEHHVLILDDTQDPLGEEDGEDAGVVVRELRSLTKGPRLAEQEVDA